MLLDGCGSFETTPGVQDPSAEASLSDTLWSLRAVSLFGSFAFIGGKKENQAHRKRIDQLAKKNSSRNAAMTPRQGRT